MKYGSNRGCSIGCCGHVTHPCEKCGKQWNPPEIKDGEIVKRTLKPKKQSNDKD